MWSLHIRLYTGVRSQSGGPAGKEGARFPVEDMLLELRPQSVKPSNLRRSTRLTIAVPVDVSGTDVQGNSFSESTRTITVNRHGGKLLLNHELRIKDLVRLTSPRLGRAVNAQVVWMGKRRTESEPREVAVELLEPGNIWGVDFPPADWNSASSIRDLVPEGDSASLAPAPTVAEAAVPEPVQAVTGAMAPTAVADSAPASEASARETILAYPPPVTVETPSPAHHGSNGNGKGSEQILSELCESVDKLLKTSLANFDEELGRIVKMHTSAFDKRAFNTAVQNIESAKKEIQQAVPGLVQDSLGQVRGQLQTEIENFATHLEELKQRTADDAASALRGRIAAALKALEG